MLPRMLSRTRSPGCVRLRAARPCRSIGGRGLKSEPRRIAGSIPQPGSCARFHRRTGWPRLLPASGGPNRKHCSYRPSSPCSMRTGRRFRRAGAACRKRPSSGRSGTPHGATGLKTSHGGQAAAGEHDWRVRILAAPENRRRGVLREEVRALAAKVLGAAPRSVDLEEPLRDLGLDSLMAVELRNRLGAAVGRTLPATITFDCPTVACTRRLPRGRR